MEARLTVPGLHGYGSGVFKSFSQGRCASSPAQEQNNEKNDEN
jgi:hypothetical protein